MSDPFDEALDPEAIDPDAGGPDADELGLIAAAGAQRWELPPMHGYLITGRDDERSAISWGSQMAWLIADYLDFQWYACADYGEGGMPEAQD